MTARLIFSQLASSDQAEILTYLAGWASGQTTVRFRELFSRVYGRISDHPQSGALRPALGPDIRIAVVAPYVVIYQFDGQEDTVTVLRVLDGRRKISGELLKSRPSGPAP